MIKLEELDNNTKALVYVAIALAVISIVGTLIYNYFSNRTYSIKGIEYTIPSDYNFVNAIEDGYVIYTEKHAINEYKVEQFYNDVQNNKDASITHISYNSMGAPLVDQYHHKNGEIILFVDYTRDISTDNPYKDKVYSIKVKDIEIAKNLYGQKYIQDKHDNQ